MILAQFQFTRTVNAGAIIIVIIILALYGVGTWRDRDSKRWKGLYELADAERKEVQAKLDETNTRLAECTAALVEANKTIAKLDAMQMPIKIVEIMNSSVVRIDEQAKQRLGDALAELRHESEKREARDQERHDALMVALGELREAIHRMNLS